MMAGPRGVKRNDPRLDKFRIGDWYLIEQDTYVLKTEKQETRPPMIKYKLTDITSRGLYIFESPDAARLRTFMWYEILEMFTAGRIKEK